MYCGQCGKRVLDDMLFCPFCGSPIVIPDQDEPKPEGESGAKIEPEAKPAVGQAEESEAPAVEVPAVEAAAEDSGEVAEEAPAEDSGEIAEEAGAEIPEEIPAEDAAPKSARWEDTAFPIDEAEQAAPAAKSPFLDRSDAEEAADVESAPPAGELEPEGEVAPFEPLPLNDRPEDWPDDSAPSRGGDASPRSYASLFDDLRSAGDASLDRGADEHFAPLEIGKAEAPAKAAPPKLRRDEPQRRTSPQRRAPVGGGRSVTQTFIPVRDVDPNDMFMDSAHPAAPDDYDPYDDDGPEDDFDDGFAFEDSEPEGFFQRHIRGLVGVILLLALLAVFLVWGMLPSGQRVLASANLAWNADVYNDLGYEAYQAGEFHKAASCFERALARDGDNYDYAHSAMVAYYEGGETSSALAMLKRCIDMEPDNPEPYAELLILYPDAASRPWDVRQLLRQGYERTGEETLNVAGE